MRSVILSGAFFVCAFVVGQACLAQAAPPTEADVTSCYAAAGKDSAKLTKCDALSVPQFAQPPRRSPPTLTAQRLTASYAEGAVVVEVQPQYLPEEASGVINIRIDGSDFKININGLSIVDLSRSLVNEYEKGAGRLLFTAPIRRQIGGQVSDKILMVSIHANEEPHVTFYDGN